MRSFEIPGTAHQPPATGTVSIVFSPGKVEAVTLIDDKGLLPAITDDIKKTKFDVEFPNTNPARLVRRGVVSCRTGHACEVVLIPVDDRNMLSAE